MARNTPTIAPHPFKPGDVVAALANTKHVPEGSVGRVAILSATGHPIVDFPARGRVLITADELVAHDGPLPSSPDRVPLRDEPAPREIVPIAETPKPDWCDPPDPALLKPAVVVQMPRPIWPPAEDRAAPDSGFRKAESEDAALKPRGNHRKLISDEGRARMRAAQQSRRAVERAAKEQEREAVEPTTEPAAEPPSAALPPAPAEETRTEPSAQPEQAPAPGPVALLRTNLLDASPDTLTIGRLPQPVMIPVPHELHDELAQQIVSTRRVLILAATRGLESRTVLDLARLLVSLDEEHMTL